MDLSCCPFIVQDLQWILARRVIEPKEYQQTDDLTIAAAAAAIETPVYRREQGLWPHQKYFARLALERHRLGGASSQAYRSNDFDSQSIRQKVQQGRRHGLGDVFVSSRPNFC